MPLTTQDIWIAKFTGGVGLAPDARAELSLKQHLKIARLNERREEMVLREAYVQRAHKQAEALSAELSVFQRARVETSSGTLDMIGEGGDQTKAFGFEADIGSVKRSPEELQAMVNAKGKVLAIEDGLKRVRVRRSFISPAAEAFEKAHPGEPLPDTIEPLEKRDEPLFEDKDIENELYTPMVRRLVFPEDQVDSAYSATQRMIDGSNQYYIDELVARSEAPTDYDELGSAMKAVVSATKNVAAATVGLVASVDMVGATTEQAAKIVDTQALINLGLTVGEAVVNTAIDVGVQIKKADATGAVSVVLSGLSAAVQGLVYKYTDNYALSVFISTGMKGASRLPMMVSAFLGEDPAEVKAGKFIDQLGLLVGDAFDIASAAKNDADDPNNTQNLKDIALFKAGATTAFKAVATGLKGKVITKIRDRDWRGLGQICVSISSDIVQGALAGAQAQDALDRKAAISADADGAIKQGLIDKGYDPTDENFQALYDDAKLKAKIAVSVELGIAGSQQSGSIGSLAAGINGLIDQGGEDDPLAAKLKEREEALKAAQATADLAASEAAVLALEAEEAEFEEALRLMGKGDPTDGELQSIGKLIAKMKRDALIIQTASAVGSAGFAIATQFFAPMAVAGTLIKFLEALTAAVNRAIEMRNWVDANEAALNAVSPYLTAIKNFVRNQAEQFAHYTIKCALLAVQAAGQIMQAAGAGTYAQAVGLVVEKGAKLAETIEDLAFKFHKRDTLAKAWKATKPALKNPSDRKANLIARKLNPTLAKYTIAFGAVIDKDPVALEAFRIIGLSAETLAAKDAKVESVKQYLETRYSDDVQVYKSFTVEDDSWLKKAPAPALTADCFLTVHFLATSEGSVRDTKPNPITMAFREVEACAVTFTVSVRAVNAMEAFTDEGLSPHLDTFQAYEDALAALGGLLKGFQPLTTGGEPSDDLQSALRDLADLADVEVAVVQNERAAIFGRAPQVPPRELPDPEQQAEALEQARRLIGG